MDCGISEGYHCEGALVGAGGLESVPPVSDNVDWNGYMLTVFSTGELEAFQEHLRGPLCFLSLGCVSFTGLPRL